MIFIIWLIQDIIAIVACVIIGNEKNRNGLAWGAFFGLFGLLILALLPPLESRKNYVSTSAGSRSPSDTEKKCITCGAFIDVDAKKCPECGSTNFSNSTIGISDSLNTNIITGDNTSETCTIVCPNCSKRHKLQISSDKFLKMKCDKCNKMINKNNVMFE